MTILSVVKDVCLNVGVTVPVSVFSGISADRTMLEIVSLANEMAQRIAYDTREWTRLKKPATLVGNGTKTAFDLPADFKRMLLTAKVWRSSSAQTPMRFVPDTDEWLQRRAQGYTDSRGEWTNYGGQMHLSPALAADETATFMYLSRNCISLSGGGFSETFLTDTDAYSLDERLLKLGMIWQWKASKGSPYTEDMGTYGDALVLAMGNDSPSPIIVGRDPLSVGAVAYPWQVPT